MYLVWTCLKCGDIKVSNNHRHHELNMCKCGSSGVDYEEYYTRILGLTSRIIKMYDYNFFDELVIGLLKQGVIELVKIDGFLGTYYSDVELIRKLEDEICEGLK